MTSLCPRCRRPLEDDEPYICCAGVELRWRCADCDVPDCEHALLKR